MFVPFQALGMRKDDTFSTTMLGYTLEKLAEDTVDDDCEYQLFIDVLGSETEANGRCGRRMH